MIAAIAIIIIIIYLTLIGSLTYGFDNIELFKLQDLKAKTKFSVVIPFRNEAKYLPALLKSILKLNYPKDLFEIILVNDNSEDDSVTIITGILSTSDNIKIIDNIRISHSPKKDAISLAIDESKHEWIITSDADCVFQKYWLDAFDEYIQTKDTNCIVAPVRYTNNPAFIKAFQALDVLSLQGATIGGFGLKQAFLCNGANFAYRKSIFRKLNGFNDNKHIASGDDIFLLEKFKQFDAKKVNYLKSSEAIVFTHPVNRLSQLLHQRIRWASKTSHNPNKFSKAVGLIVFLGNLVCLILPVLFFLNLIEERIAIALFVIKFAIDFLLLFKASRFFKQERVLVSYLASSILYPFFSVYVALLSLFRSYNWKGRVFKK